MDNVLQTNFFDYKEIFAAPNISQVPKYSPFRFPGGKTWFYPFAKMWMQKQRAKVLVEPFAGGASIGMTAAIENWVEKVVLVELDKQIATVWECILSGRGGELAELILGFELNNSNVDLQLCNDSTDIVQRALATLILNRINHGGILTSGSGRLKFGEAGKGILSRWYPKTLNDRILKIDYHKNKFDLFQSDGIKKIEQYSFNRDTVFFIDPPYTIAGKRLYDHHQIDHSKLFNTLHNISNKFLLTYDDTPFIVDLVNKYNFEYEKILMTTTHHRKKYELIISSDLSWLR